MKLSELLERFSEVRQEGSGYVVPCPAHDDSHPSLYLSVTDEGQLLWKCRAGCTQDAVQMTLGVPGWGWESDVVVTSQDPAAKPPRGSVAALASYCEDAAQRLDDEATAYALRRFGLSPEQAHELGLGVAEGEDPWPLVGSAYKASKRLVVPFRDFTGTVVGMQGRALEPDAKVRWCGPTNPKEGKWARWGAFMQQTGEHYVIICEGPGDALTSYAHGYSSVAIRGAALTSDLLADELATGLRGMRVMVAGDADKAGQDFTQTVASALAVRGVEVYRLAVADGYGDLSEWFEGNPEGFASDLYAAIRGATQVVTQASERGSLVSVTVARQFRGWLVGAKGSDVRHADELGYLLLRGGIWIDDSSGSKVRAFFHEFVDTQVQRWRGVVQEQREEVAELTEAVKLNSTLQPQLDEALESLGEASAMLKDWRRYENTYAIDGALKELGTLHETLIEPDDLDQHPDLLAVRNGVVDLRTGELMPHDPLLYLTKKLELDYDPEATCPRWERFLVEVLEQPELPAFIQRLIGYGITGRTDEQCFTVLWGRGANGKSVFTDTLTEVFRAQTVVTPFSTFEKRAGGIPNDIAALRGSRLVMASEGEVGEAMSESTLKRVTGQDYVTARFMRKEFFSFKPEFLILLATNHKPRFKGQDEGLWRRVKLVNFGRYFAPHERDHRLQAELLQEAQGILTWAVRGAMAWYSQGLAEPDVVKNATKEYREMSDPLGGFFPGLLVERKGSEVLQSEAHSKYVEWLDEEDRGTRPWSSRAFGAALEERGVLRATNKNGRVLLDVGWADEEPEQVPTEVPTTNPQDTGQIKLGDI